jgi:hypothetical protein
MRDALFDNCGKLLNDEIAYFVNAPGRVNAVQIGLSDAQKNLPGVP